MNKGINFLFLLLIACIIWQAETKARNIKKIESYLAHQHGYDVTKELGFYNPFKEKP